MRLVSQKIFHPGIGDCFRACMASLLDLPSEVLPNDFSPAWRSNWQNYLKQFGITLSHDSRADKPIIWLSTPWIATVKSLNYKDGLHAILMHEGGIVLHDPSIKKRYKAGRSLLGEDIVVSGTHLIVDDASLLHRLNEYRLQLQRWDNPEPTLSNKSKKGE